MFIVFFFWNLFRYLCTSILWNLSEWVIIVCGQALPNINKNCLSTYFPSCGQIRNMWYDSSILLHRFIFYMQWLFSNTCADKAVNIFTYILYIFCTHRNCFLKYCHCLYFTSNRSTVNRICFKLRWFVLVFLSYYFLEVT